MAAIVCRPVLSPDTANVPMPAVRLTGDCGEPSMLKVSEPVGVPAPGETTLTVPVNVTDWPVTDGLTDELTVVVVLAWLTVCVRSEDVVLTLKLLSPLYVALIV